MAPTDAYRRLAEHILNAGRYDFIRWSRAVEASLDGEAKALLNRFGISSYQSKPLANLLSCLHFVNKQSVLFLPEEGKGSYYGANIGVILNSRVSGLSDEEVKAQSFIKVWMSNNAEQFASSSLPKLLRYNGSRSNPVRIPLDALLRVILRWDEHKTEIITALSQEYFTKGNTK